MTAIFIICVALALFYSSCTWVQVRVFFRRYNTYGYVDVNLMHCLFEVILLSIVWLNVLLFCPWL